MSMSKATILTATYRIVTPMFCGGADQQSAELRLPSFKGALRFWWRSLMWGKVNGDVKELQNQEADLFGSSGAATGQSKIRLRIASEDLKEVVYPKDKFEDGRLLGAHYLGYGVMHAFRSSKGAEAGELTRGMVPSGSFTVECRFSRFTNDDSIEDVRRALVLLGTVGGLGSKSRKGFGSLSITELTGTDVEMDPGVRLLKLMEKDSLDKKLPDWTAWSGCEHLRVVKVASNQKRAVDLLNAIGREQVLFRSWGSNYRGKFQEHQTFNQPSEQNFKIDHDKSKPPHKGPVPHRVAFGLPHNYQTGGVKPTSLERRASPLFIHIDQVADDVQPTALLAFLPSKFLPDGETINAFGNRVELKLDDSFWYPIHGLLDRLISNGNRPPDRPGYECFPQDSTWWKKDNSNVNAEEVQLG